MKRLLMALLAFAACSLTPPALAGILDQVVVKGLTAAADFQKTGDSSPARPESGGSKRAPAEWKLGATIDVKVLHVIDGDTIRVQGNDGVADVRLHGLDAPEWNQNCKDASGSEFACGASATAQMVEILRATPIPCPSARMHGKCVKGGLPVECTVVDLDRRWGRPVARCTAGRDDIARELISRGFAKSAYSQEYAAVAANARYLKRGLWAGTFPDPAEFRHKR